MAPHTLYEFLFKSLIENARELAISSENCSWTYHDLDALSKTGAHFLQASGYVKGDRIVLFTGNSVWFAPSFLSIIRVGAVPVPLLPYDAISKTMAIIREVHPKLIIVRDEESREMLSREDHTIPVAVASPNDMYSPPHASKKFHDLEMLPGDTALIQYTSGSTGKPKGVVLSHGAFGSVLGVADYLNSLSRRRLSLGIPLAHAYGLTCMIEYLVAGAHILIEKRFLLPTNIFNVLSKNMIQALEGPPTLYEMACKNPSFNSRELPELCYLAMNTAKPRMALLHEIKERFPEADIVVRYGISEIAGPISRLVLTKDIRGPLDSCGKPADPVRVEIVDDNNQAVSENELGEIVVESPGCMDGYVDGDNSNLAAKHTYRTGDIGYINPNGYLYILGRKNFMIKSAGHRIFPKEIEDIISSVPGVRECAVGGVPDELLGEKICAWIVPEAGSGKDDLRQHVLNACNNLLEPAKVPHVIRFKKALPKTASNKVTIAELAQEIRRDGDGAVTVVPRPIEKDTIPGRTAARALQLYDNTLRDGEQSIGVYFTAKDKVKIATELVQAGITYLEAGFACVSKEERQSIRAVVEADVTPFVFSLARLTKNDIDAAIQAGVKHVTVFVPSSDALIGAMLKISPDEIMDSISGVVEYAKKNRMFVKFSCEDATHASVDRLIAFYSAAREAGADYISVADTTGVGVPEKISRLIRTLKRRVKLPVSYHGHNDLGLAVANSIAAATAGADEIQVTINGLGERAGNTAMDEFVMAMKVGYGIDLGVDLLKMIELSRMVAAISGRELAANKPITGKNSFRHKSGIHVKALLREDLMTYEPFPPHWIGREHEVEFGKHSGRSNIRYLCRQIGLSIGSEEEGRIIDRVKSQSIKLGRDLYRSDVMEIIREIKKT